MDSAKARFLQIIGDYIDGRKSNTENADEELCLYANQHQLSSIIYFQTKEPSLLTLYSVAVSSYVNRRIMCENLMGELKKKGLNAFQIKGNVIAQYYPQPALRTSGDCDIVISDLETAHSVMLENGFECLSNNIGREWQYKKNRLEFEIHDRIVFDEVINKKEITDFLNDFWPYVKDGVLDMNFHFIYIIAHLRKHLMNSGVGFRQFLDVAILEKNCSELNWPWIEQKLKELGLLRFTENVFAFVERWWGIEPKIRAASISDDFFNSETERIFSNGIFGFDNRENDNYLAANEARSESRLLGALKMVFPSYSSLCASDTYAFLRGKPVLLPFAWIYRLCKSIKRGNMNIKLKRVTGKFVSKEYVSQREEMFKNWGLSD